MHVSRAKTLMSDREQSAHTDTYTPNTLNTELLEKIKKLQAELAQTKAENQIYKAQVEERSSSSTLCTESAESIGRMK